MSTYVALVDFTAKGVENLSDTLRRADDFVQLAESKGVKVKDLYWTTGGHDGILIIEAEDEALATSMFLKLASAGYVRTQTMRAFDRAELESCLSK